MIKILDVLLTALSYNLLRMALAWALGVLVWRLVPKKWDKLRIWVMFYMDLLTPATSILAYFLLTWAVRVYFCPLDMPLFCDFPIAVSLDPDYINYWSVFIGLVILFGVVHLISQWNIIKLLKGGKDSK